MSAAPIAVLYDVHGNLTALEAVLGAAEREGAVSFVLGGDYASFGPWPRETAELLETLPAVVRIRGNVERWLKEKPEAPASALAFLTPALNAARDSLGPELVERLYRLPEQAELDGILVCHGSPVSDVESFAPEPQAGEESMLGGEARTDDPVRPQPPAVPARGTERHAARQPRQRRRSARRRSPCCLGALREPRDPLPADGVRRRAGRCADALLRRMGGAGGSPDRVRVRPLGRVVSFGSRP